MTKKAKETPKQAAKRMAKLRARKKPAKYKNIYPSVLAKPDDDPLSLKNVKEWIKHVKEEASAFARSARGSSSKAKERAQAAADNKLGYVRFMEHYLRTGDWISNYMGKEENQKINWKCVAMAYYPDGTPKRSEGVWYPDIKKKWSNNMTVMSELVAITDKQFAGK